ncbi:glycogen synthase GlgA [Ciceribacter sp. L1K23]|uniref:glycogen synthase GlgA n=1 Tax=Ciceribacter sp. L1K23 TaxID=2820276 RepID=UPI001B81B000|nr:glycogen synthase GlgA [Ciceribacter sp. L1K23]MBR0558137.1 glycogen synthase GlgA [Ciceribacter sp. L1K23]
MKILSVASELFPLVKTGGLADVTGALPLALKDHGVEVRTLLPAYPSVLSAVGTTRKLVDLGEVLGERATLLSVSFMGLDLLLLDAPGFFNRKGGPYLDQAGKDYPDNWKRFAALAQTGAEIAAGLLPDWRPDLVHAHDWQAALTPVYMRYAEAPEIPSLLTIHNIAFQGQFPAEHFGGLQLPPHAFMEVLEYYGTMSFMKAGLLTAHAISTVSPSYAEEILTPEFGMGLEGVIGSRAPDLHGIVNGIDATIWNPARDPSIDSGYTSASLKKRKANRTALAQAFSIDDDDGPLFCVISRLTWQKGMDLLPDVVDQIIAAGGRLVVLGSGEFGIEGALVHAASRHASRVGVKIGYDEPLSHLMQAGSDAILIPSRFEPCGLTQLYGLRYGCVPVVARTGGLNDTVIDANEAALASQAATGIQFWPVTVEGLRQALRRTFRLYRDDKTWGQMQKAGMKSDVSWGRSAARYADLYKSLTSKGQ